MFPVMSAGNPISGYNINNSLRFRGSATAYLNRTVGTTSNQTTYTYSAWIKRGAFTSGVESQFLIQSDNYTTSGIAGDFQVFINPSDYVQVALGGTSVNYNIITSQVLRDPSAWYHIVAVVDTTNATAANRLKLYINGSQVTAFSSSSYPPQNTASRMNLSGTTPTIGAFDLNGTRSRPFDGYQAEVNFIDGQALTPSSFGETSTTTGVWQPKAYTGTYGTNGFYLPFTLNSTSTYQANYTSSSQYLNVASNAAFGYGTGDFTIEGWHYATASGTSYLFDQRTTTTQLAPAVYINGGSYIVYINGASALTAGTVVTNQWVHWALVRSGGTTKLYLNGISVGSFSDSNNYITSPFIIGNVWIGGGTYGWAGYLSNIRVVKGTAVYTSNFKPSSTPLTAVSGTSLLTLQNSTIIDNSTNAFSINNNGSITTSTATPFVANIAGDYSGNGNSWQPNNINYSTSGTTYDAMIDSPTLTSTTVSNYATLNPLKMPAPASASYTDGNLSVSCATANQTPALATIYPSSGKWYWEVTWTSGSYARIGVQNTTVASTDFAADVYGWRWENNTGNIYNGSNGNLSTVSTYATGDVLGFCLDLDSGKLYVSKNGTWQNSAVPASGTGAVATNIPTATLMSPAVATGSGTSVFAMNFGQRPFAYTAPTGYKALNTYNLPDSTIKAGNKYMDATLYTQNGLSTNVITNAGAFKPDLVWIKSRSGTGKWNNLVDSVRGGSVTVYSNSTNAEGTDNYINSFNSNGFTLNIGDTGTNSSSGITQVAWQWQAGQGTTSSNTSGSITSTVSVNATAGFSIVTYTGTGANATVGHGLGVAPKMIIVKSRTVVQNWIVYHASVGNTGALFLNATNSTDTNSVYWQNTTPTSAVFSLGTNLAGNTNGSTNVAYCFAEIAGFSKFGSYTGNGSADGTFVYCGFRPKFVLLKNASGAYDWYILDSSRNTYNVVDLFLYPNLSNAESQGAAGSYNLDFVSNGFKIRGTGAGINGSTNTLIYAAFAENPFKNALAR